MANTAAEKHASRTHSRSADGLMEYGRTYIVNTDDVLQTESQVLATAGLPALNLTAINGCICTKLAPKQDSNSDYIWIVAAAFKNRHPEDASQDANPLNRPYKYRWGTREVEEFTLKDKADVAFKNSADDFFDPPIGIPIAVLTLTVERYEASWTASTQLAYFNKINNDTFFGAAAGYAKCIGIAAASTWENLTQYWQVTYSFEFHPDSWEYTDVLDYGTRYKDVNDEWVQAADEKQQPISGKILLDGSGGKLARKAVPPPPFTDPTPSAPFYWDADLAAVVKRLELYDEADFDVLSLEPA